MRWSAALLVILSAPALASTDAVLTFVDARGAPVEVRTEPQADRGLLLHFWASWCPDCEQDLVHLGEAASRCEHVRVLAINAGDRQEQVDAFLARHPLRLEVLRDPGGDVWRRLDGRGLPANVFWSTRGRESEVGPKTRAQWDERLGALGCRVAAPR